MKDFFKLIYAVLLMACLVSVTHATTAPVVADTYIDSTQTSQNFGASVSIKVNSTSKALLGFKLQALPSTATANDINKATLFFYVKNVLGVGKLQVKQAYNAWTETGVTYSNAPTLGTALTSSAMVSQKGSYFAVDVTQLVKNWVTTPTENYGLVLEPDASTPTTSIMFDGKEETTTSHAAYLDIVLNGPAGATGPQGATGATGSQGAQGLTGATGLQGVQGLTGPAGAQGVAGSQGVTGATGAAGANGKTVLSGVGVPATTLGTVGDFYIDTSVSKIYGPKTATGWGIAVSLVGPQGATGAQGSQGLTGVAGATGPKGLQGLQGATGLTGATGPQGAQGLTGAAGPQGPTGAIGSQGATGATGTAGTNGKTVLNGAGVPSTSLGTVGDFYIDASASKIYGPKKTTGWGTAVSLLGPAVKTSAVCASGTVNFGTGTGTSGNCSCSGRTISQVVGSSCTATSETGSCSAGSGSSSSGYLYAGCCYVCSP